MTSNTILNIPENLSEAVKVKPPDINNEISIKIILNDTFFNKKILK